MIIESSDTATATMSPDLRARYRVLLARLSGPRVLAALAVVGAAAYVPWVSEGSQPAYVCLMGVTVVLGLIVGQARGPLAVAYLVFLVGFVGPDLNGQLGEGESLLGSLRVVDAGFVATVAGVVLGGSLHVRESVRRPGTLAAVSALGVGYAAILWVAGGAEHTPFLNADIRLVVLGALTWFVCSRCMSDKIRTLELLIALGAVLAVKAVAIYAADLYVIGPNDRLQATSVLGDTTQRVILNGGDTLLPLVPALTIILASRSVRRTERVAFAVVALGAGAAISISATRTAVLVAVALVLLTTALLARIGRIRLSAPTVAVAGVLLIAASAMLVLGGTVDRVLQPDAPHTGIEFRRDEADRFLDLGPRRTLIGKGLGGSFEGRDIANAAVETGWAHVLPVWLALKAGIVGLALALAALILVSHRAVTAARGDGDTDAALGAVVIVVGVVLLSITLGRAALVEGVVMLVLGTAFVSVGHPHTRTLT